MSQPSIVIVDYGLGNLFSVRTALERVGASGPIVSNQKTAIERADRLILPGVGAFGDGMSNLRELGLVDTIKGYASSGRPVLGVCLGMQLIMSESEEFGHHDGLDLLPGKVRLLQPGPDHRLKIPHIGWNSLHAANGNTGARQQWEESILSGVPNGSFMYFVHSYVVAPDDPSVAVSLTRYGDTEYCSVFQCGNIAGAQFHPELSGEVGLRIYRNFALGNGPVTTGAGI